MGRRSRTPTRTTPGQQVDIPTAGERINVVVSHTDGGSTTTKTYGVLVIREGPAATDTIALMALYNSTNGPNWSAKNNWASAMPLYLWTGVGTRTSDGRVISLGQNSVNMVGPLPAELGNLTIMHSLNLGGNRLSGEIPASLGNLTSLLALDLQKNRLSGEIPASLGNLTSLQNLKLNNNQLTGAIPASLGDLTSLQTLWLYSNQLSGAIPDLSRLTRMHTLNPA